MQVFPMYHYQNDYKRQTLELKVFLTEPGETKESITMVRNNVMMMLRYIYWFITCPLLLVKAISVTFYF